MEHDLEESGVLVETSFQPFLRRRSADGFDTRDLRGHQLDPTDTKVS
ncbi:hypothetical protein [Rhodococcus qingshengii]|nr:hypothetical protein [Rhodococcus qingshengii]MBW4818435.1 hypothetical protein [Rhodococcus qingshengii]